MKKIITLAALIFAAVSCGSINDLKDIKEIQKVTTNVNVVTSSISAEIPRPDSYTVKFINYDEKLEIVKTTDASGKVSTSDIVPGVYTITVQGESAKGGFTYYFSGSETNTSIVSDPKHVRVRFHSAKGDVEKVIVHYCDNYLPLKYAKTIEMDKIGEGQVEDHWGATLEAPFHRLKYTFEVIGKDGTSVVYGDRAISSDIEAAVNKDGSYFKIPYCHEIDMVKTPEWVKHTVWYQIFPERFANGDKSNDPKNVKPWNPSDHPGREDYYGGDLRRLQGNYPC